MRVCWELRKYETLFSPTQVPLFLAHKQAGFFERTKERVLALRSSRWLRWWWCGERQQCGLQFKLWGCVQGWGNTGQQQLTLGLCPPLRTHTLPLPLTQHQPVCWVCVCMHRHMHVRMHGNASLLTVCVCVRELWYMLVCISVCAWWCKFTDWVRACVCVCEKEREIFMIFLCVCVWETVTVYAVYVKVHSMLKCTWRRSAYLVHLYLYLLMHVFTHTHIRLHGCMQAHTHTHAHTHIHTLYICVSVDMTHLHVSRYMPCGIYFVKWLLLKVIVTGLWPSINSQSLLGLSLPWLVLYSFCRYIYSYSQCSILNI